MKKALKTIGWTLLALFVLLAVCLLLARFVFRDRLVALLYEVQRRERIELLRASGAYAADTTAYRFAYVQDTARAREIRAYFRLDTILPPDATAWERSLALARFVARNIPHANQRVQPETRNATALWEYHRTVEPAFNCRLHAILLHELLLASGVVNRFVTCLPFDSEDRDCHVVNLVWLPERRKWAMIDSDMQAWVSDPAGVPLSLAEMRERCLAEEPMEVHRLLGEANDPDSYRAYWAKNLYWFECREQTGYDREVNCEGRRVALLPSGFAGFGLGGDAVCTTDDCRFWAAPEAADERE